ncbi:YXWGXW repeat-containing protein [Paraburkholderia mimosarum]|uniref:YXWGXW repeat-containing protein n=1 Tax=Paraburkholderia mimosarum TaxID=312026 RepID=UPI00040BC106|nr:YXWGXW repeat-containing protein [Paraburkholderia mimosarum]
MNRRSLRDLFVSVLLASTAPAAFSQPVIVEPNAPPPPPREETVPAPRAGYVWDAGHWSWDRGVYVWTPGHWQEVRSGYEWVPGHWVEDGANWRWIPGHWA